MDWNRFGVNYANNEGMRQSFNGFNDNRHRFNGEYNHHFSGEHKNGQWSDLSMSRSDLRGERGQKPISLAVQTRRRVEVIPYNVENEEIEPQVIEITSKPRPLAINFRTHSSALTFHQIYNSNNEEKPIEEKTTNAKPYRMKHKILKPVVQEVNEYIQPFRHFVQHIEPVVEDIKTVVPEKEHKDNEESDMTSDGQFAHNRHDWNRHSFDHRFDDFESNHQNRGFESKHIDFDDGFDHFRPDGQTYEPHLHGFELQSNPRISYRLIPLMLKKSDISVNNQINESLFRERIAQVLKYLDRI